MRKRRRMRAILVIALALGAVCQASAAETDAVLFKGEAQKFVTRVSGDTFTAMRPAESRTMRMTLENDSSESRKFYMGAKLLDNFAAKGDGGALYRLEIRKSQEPIFAADITGESWRTVTGEALLQEDKRILLGTLAAGEAYPLEVTVTLDGETTDNSYMNQEGQFQLIFSVEKLTETTKKQVIQTGDLASPILLLAVMAGVAVPVLRILKKRKR